MASTFALGVIELASIYKGFEVQDMVLKSTQVEKLLGRSICSGKYLIIVKGMIADVEACLETARQIGGFAVINAEIVPRVDPKVLPAIAGATTLDGEGAEALLILETMSVTAAIKAADFAVHEADINLLRIHVAMAVGGKGLVIATGSIGALKSAVQPALDYLQNDGTMIGYSLITGPHPDLVRDLL